MYNVDYRLSLLCVLFLENKTQAVSRFANREKEHPLGKERLRSAHSGLTRGKSEHQRTRKKKNKLKQTKKTSSEAQLASSFHVAVTPLPRRDATRTHVGMCPRTILIVRSYKKITGDRDGTRQQAIDIETAVVTCAHRHGPIRRRVKTKISLCVNFGT